MCRLVGELLRLTHPFRTQYQPSLGAWHDAKGGEVASMRVFRTLGEALDMPGLRAVGSLLAARTAQMLTAATRYIEDELEAGRHPGSITTMMRCFTCQDTLPHAWHRHTSRCHRRLTAHHRSILVRAVSSVGPIYSDHAAV